MRRVLALALVLVPALARAQREADPQQHEVDVSVDISVETAANAALFDLQYTFTPAGIDRRDVVPAIVRRFERHPSSLWAHIVHDGGSREAITSARLGGILNPVDFLYLEGEAGVERNLTLFDAPGQGGREYGYFAARLRAGVGVRPSDLWSIGAFYEARPVIGTDTDDNFPEGAQSQRSGGEHTFGGTTTFATPGERLFATISAYGHIADWSFINFFPGDLTVRGFGGDVRLGYLITFWTTLQLRTAVTHEHWVDKRINDDTLGIVGADLDRQVTTVHADLDLIYFHQSRYGFRFSLGGGFVGAPPLYNTRDRGVFTLGVGTIIRF
jgi:hypothetical protein